MLFREESTPFNDRLSIRLVCIPKDDLELRLVRYPRHVELPQAQGLQEALVHERVHREWISATSGQREVRMKRNIRL